MTHTALDVITEENKKKLMHFVTMSENVTAGRKYERFFLLFFGDCYLLLNISEIALVILNWLQEDAFCAKFCANRLRDD